MGATEIIVIFLVYLMFFGAKGIPSLARTMGRAVRSFEKASTSSVKSWTTPLTCAGVRRISNVTSSPTMRRLKDTCP